MFCHVVSPAVFQLELILWSQLTAKCSVMPVYSAGGKKRSRNKSLPL